MKSLPHSFRDMFEETPTAVINTLGSLVVSPAIVVTPTTPIGEVRRLLVHHRVPAVAVVDLDDQLLGVITRTDVLRIVDDEDATAGDAMSTFVFALPSRSSIEKAAALMAYEGVGQIVVTGSGSELVGMVSALDVTRYFAIEAGYLVE